MDPNKYVTRHVVLDQELDEVLTRIMRAHELNEATGRSAAVRIVIRHYDECMSNGKQHPEEQK